MELNSKRMDYRTGALPERYPLATSLTPIQESVQPVYESGEALVNGTLFPGLNLPFMNVMNTELPAGPKTELMALDFVSDELGLYLDTHADDREAFALLQTVLAMGKEARRRYIELFGPLQKTDLISGERYAWLCDPWPWDAAAAKKEG